MSQEEDSIISDDTVSTSSHATIGISPSSPPSPPPSKRGFQKANSAFQEGEEEKKPMEEEGGSSSCQRNFSTWQEEGKKIFFLTLIPKTKLIFFGEMWMEKKSNFCWTKFEAIGFVKWQHKVTLLATLYTNPTR